MFLSIDVGNTQTTLGLYDTEGVGQAGWRLATVPTDTSDMLRASLHDFFAMDGEDLDGVEAAGLACVVPVLARAWTRCLEREIGVKPLLITSEMAGGLNVGLPNRATIGADRLANAVAAQESYGSPVIVVDFGTATNIDVVDRDGVYRGGAISPGVMVSAAALFSHAAKLSSVPIEAPAHALGDTTETAVQSGLVIGAAAQAEGLVARIKGELDIPDAQVVATGGLARTVSAATDLFDVVDDDLTLRGVFLIWQNHERVLAERRRQND